MKCKLHFVLEEFEISTTTKNIQSYFLINLIAKSLNKTPDLWGLLVFFKKFQVASTTSQKKLMLW